MKAAVIWVLLFSYAGNNWNNMMAGKSMKLESQVKLDLVVREKQAGSHSRYILPVFYDMVTEITV